MNEHSTKDDIEYVWGDDATLILHDVQIRDSGRITIRKKRREKYGIDIDDFVHLVIHTNGETFRTNDVQVGRKGQVTIPLRQRERYGVDIGDTVTAELKAES